MPMRLHEISEARVAPTEDEMIAVAKRLSRQQFLDHYIPRQTEPTTYWTAYDQDGTPVAAFREDRVESYRKRGMEVRATVPTPRKLAAYANYLKKRQALDAKFIGWAQEGRLSEFWGFDPNEVSVRYSPQDDQFVAQWKGKRVGVLQIDLHQKSDPPDVRHVFNVAVRAEVRRQGLGSRLYDAAEAWLAQQGLRLVPSPVQHPDGKAFWRAGNNPRLLRARN